MVGWKKTIQNIGLILFDGAFCFLLLVVFPVRADEMNSEKYLFSFKTYKSSCLLRVNNFPAIDNATIYSGTMSAGFNFTAFLENGANDIELLMGPQNIEDSNTLFTDSSCQVIISKETRNTSTEIANFTLSVNNQGKITANGSANYTSGVSSGIFNTEIWEGYTNDENDYDMYKLRSNLILRDLPRWSWVNATPVTERDLLKIRKAYADIWLMMKERDIEGLKQITRISNQEMAFAEGVTTGMIFISTGFPQHVINKQLSPIPIVWDEYELITYRGGRLFRLGAGFFQVSPLQFKDSKGNVVFSYNPYFSIIDGKVTLVR
ncbi:MULTISPECIES: IdsF [unclassified Brenneria]|uniref:IdsF n=1 Tax=unclassified Brenneria TaxID=2634434 RepID=UPI0018F0B1EE|nr:IdsF [Brenneria sp. L3-3C-1]MBJ7223029.1 IdsF [Brenneria sp. L3-3C-1]MEE3644268.1 IdsF [Brenneria sp. L3_3C_1]